MRKRKGVQVGLRLDSHVVLYLMQMPGDNDAEKLRQLINDGIEFRKKIQSIVDNLGPFSAVEVPK